MKEVESERNPDLDLWREYKSGDLTLEEFLLAVYSRVANGRLEDFKRKHIPEKPIEYRMREKKFFDSLKELDDELERRALKKKFYKDIKERFKSYEIQVSIIEFDNKSNLDFLHQMYEFLKEKAPNIALVVLGAIETHKVERWGA